MRKIVFSTVVKLIAVLLLIASILGGVLTVTTGLYEYFAVDEDIYAFEEDFSESWFVSSLLNTPQSLMDGVYHHIYYEYNEYGLQSVKEPTDALRAAFTEELVERFGNPHNFEKIDYYVQWNDLIFTNCQVEKPEDVLQGEFYSYFKRDPSGGVEYSSSNVDYETIQYYLLDSLEHLDQTSTVVISCSIKDEAVQHYKAIWETQKSIVYDTIAKLLTYAVAALLLFIYLLCVCGKQEDGTYRNMWLDHIWLEVHLAAIAGAAIGVIYLCAYMIDDYVHSNYPHDLVYQAMGAIAGLGSLIIITSGLSIVRNIKTSRLMETSIILKVLRWVIRMTVRILKWNWKVTKAFWGAVFGLASRKTGTILIAMLLVYTAFIGIFGILTPSSGGWLLLGILLFGGGCYVLAYRARDLDAIKKGVSEVRNGNVAYKIPEVKCQDMKALAANINDIAQGLDEPVSAKMKAERMKTELITNVSHDLKTPLTSIISYTELLSKVEGLPEEARDYVAVIARKSDRLKQLTQDLFDISKVQSGNDDVVLEKLNVSLLINQGLGEHDNEIQNSGLPFCVDTPKELFISADGRKMSRVVSNLIQNILKYTMTGTRVFITASEKDGMIVMEFKNISAYPLDFDAEEITHRFVRGDKSRTAEGSGLGLAIAKSYTEICNGTFEIVVDGDMFKAILKFRKYS